MGNELDIVIFEHQTWQQIPDQDNPAMHRDRKQSLMIFKGNRESYHITNGGFVVVHVQPGQDITLKGVFWHIEDAKMFAQVFSKRD